jgi:hypothetical protein
MREYEIILTPRFKGAVMAVYFSRFFLFISFVVLILLTTNTISFAQQPAAAPAADAAAKPAEAPTMAPAPAAPTQIEAKVDAPPAKPTNSEHYFGFHGAIGIPHPVTAGLDYVHSSKLFSAELSAGDYKFTYSGTDIQIKNSQIALRWHPWAGSFFAGSYYGSRTISGEKSEVISGIKATVKADITTNYVTPVIGWLWGIDNGGFFASFEIGYQAPSNVKTTYTTNASAAVQLTTEYQTLDTDIKDAGKKIGEANLPHITLFKIGWLF